MSIEGMKDFTVLQKKTFPTGVYVSLCPTMDICAVLSNSSGASSTSHVLDAFRTFSWEKNFSKSDIVGSSVSAFAFSPSGKVLAVGSEDGSVAVLDLESSNSATALSEEQLPCATPTTPDTRKTPITAIAWAQLGATLPEYMDCCYQHIWAQGGPNLAARAGMRELYEAEDVDNESMSEAIPLPTLLSSVAHTLLITLNSEAHRLNIYGCGVYLIHSIDLSSPQFSLQHLLTGADKAVWGRRDGVQTGRAQVITSNSGQTSCITLCRRLYSTNTDSGTDTGVSTGTGTDAHTNRNTVEVNVADENVLGHALPHAGLHITLVRHLSFITTYRWHQHKIHLLLQMQKDMARIDSLLLECGKKWRDAAKVIPIKLSLLANTLKGYEMEYTPIQFFYTIVLFGQWHPAAQSSFASHWNEQGLQRLRSSITAAARDIEKRLQMYVIPVLTNFLLSCRELVGIEEAEGELIAKQPSSSTRNGVQDIINSRKLELNNLINNSEWLIYKVDEALHECKFAGRNLLLFLKFLKENMLVAAADESTEETNASPQQVPPSNFLPLFDPRIPRAPEGVSGPKAQAECVTGTHLYAHFLEAPLPADMVEYRKPFNGFYSNIRVENLPGFKNMDTLKEILKIAEINSDFDADAFAKVSLLSQFKGTNALFQQVLQHGQHVPNMQFNPSFSRQTQLDEHDHVDLNIIFNFQNTCYGQILADDVIHVHGMAISTNDKKDIPHTVDQDAIEENSADEESDSDDDSIVAGNLLINNGHLIVFALTSFEFLILWRLDSDSVPAVAHGGDGDTCNKGEGVEWYAALIALDLPVTAGIESSALILTAMKLYSCAPAESHPPRVALVGCLSPQTNINTTSDDTSGTPTHLVLKVDLLATEFEYTKVTDMIVDCCGSTENVALMGTKILKVFEEAGGPERVIPKLRHINFGGNLVEIKTCASRGLLSLMLADGTDHHGVARQMIILDMEEDEEDDEDDDDMDEEEESAGDHQEEDDENNCDNNDRDNIMML